MQTALWSLLDKQVYPINVDDPGVKTKVEKLGKAKVVDALHLALAMPYAFYAFWAVGYLGKPAMAMFKWGEWLWFAAACTRSAWGLLL